MPVELAWPATIGRNERLDMDGEPFDVPTLTCALVASMTANCGGCGFPEKEARRK